MATLTSYAVLDYGDTKRLQGSIALEGTVTTNSQTGVLTVGQHRLIHLSAISGTTGNRCALSYTLGNSVATGTTTAPNPTDSSPFFLGDEGYVIDTGFYDQINLGNRSTYNGAVTISYSISILSKN